MPAEKPSSPPTETLAASYTPTKNSDWKSRLPKFPHWKQQFGISRWGHLLAGMSALAAAVLTASNSTLSQFLERQTHTLFFTVRGDLAPPSNIVILAIDQNSLDQGTEVYPTDPQKYAYLEPLRTSPPRRSAYAIAIERVMAAGAKAVAVDVVMDGVSNYPEDDRQLQQALTQSAGRVTLAAQFEIAQLPQGDLIQLVSPRPFFSSQQLIGFTNYPLDPISRKIHLLSSVYPKLEVAAYQQAQQPELAEQFLKLSAETPSFPASALQAAQLTFPPPQGEYIFFYGQPGNFQHIPIWYVLDPRTWQVELDKGTFKDKIVLIGATATSFRDIFPTPVGEMAGIEIHANAIATLMENRAIVEAVPDLLQRGLLVLVIGVTAGYLSSRQRLPLRRFAVTVGIAGVWLSLGYLAFTYGLVAVPVAVPAIAMICTGTSYLIVGSMSEQLQKRKLQATLQPYAASPLVQEIVSQIDDEDLRHLLTEPKLIIVGRKLKGRYQVLEELGSGGFGKTYIAEDRDLPHHPRCVVKQLKPASNNPKLFAYARQLFEREAKTLAALGQHNQIPELLAYFDEDQEFYLVQEFIEGLSLDQEISVGKRLPEIAVVALLKELLQILEFVHSQRVIHRDIKPSNIIRRQADSKLVLIDFGAVKEARQPTEHMTDTAFTIGIGTDGFMPAEQSGGNPQPSSDIYAVGMVAIEALTGLPPKQRKLLQDPESGEILWQGYAQHVSQSLTNILCKMVRYDFRQRYQSATEVLQDLKRLPTYEIDGLLGINLLPHPATEQDLESDTETQLWPHTSGNIPDLPPTESPDLPPTNLS
ncbi:CHASE2 domain-containing protein [Pantanalinema rosaneae CENA516]|uniref:CHASE2 domain-containing protein n=1 Tax=Pantanalinema rosaneae TaxID=1620701 RepID=UPI003D6E2092